MHLNLENDKCITYQAWFTVQKPGRRLRKWASRLFNPSTFSFRPITHIFRSKVILVIRKCNFFFKIGDCISARIYCWLQKKKKFWVQKRDLINLVSGFIGTPSYNVPGFILLWLILSLQGNFKNKMLIVFTGIFLRTWFRRCN